MILPLVTVERVIDRFRAPGPFSRYAVPICATLLLLYLRSQQTFETPQFWAEDGREFFQDEKLYGIGSLLMPYAGYLHIVPRLIALGVSPFSATEAPALFATASVLVTLWSAMTIGATTAPFAWLLGALLMAPPHSGEIFGTVTNLQWLMAPALVAVIATQPPPSAAARVNQGVFVFASSFSGPFSIIALPLVIWRALKGRSDPRSQVVCAIAVAGAMMQAFWVVRTQGPHVYSVAPVHLAHAILDRWIGQLAHGGPTTTRVEYAENCLVLAGIVPLLFIRSRFFLKLFLFSALLVIAVWFKFLGEPRDSFDHLLGNDRYLYVPRLFVVWALAVVMMRHRPSSVIAAAALFTVCVNYSSWKKPLVPVLSWRSEAWPIDHGGAVRIVINPLTGDDADAWTVTLPPRP